MVRISRPAESQGRSWGEKTLQQQNWYGSKGTSLWLRLAQALATPYYFRFFVRTCTDMSQHPMGLKVQYVVSVLLCAHLLLTSPACKICPAGEFQKSCGECAPCPAGRYTDKWNREESCHRCSGDCRPEFNQVVIKNCSSTSNLKCKCQIGFRCLYEVTHTDNCRKCVATAMVRAIPNITKKRITTTVPDYEQTYSSSTDSSTDSSTARLCIFPDCDAQTVNSSHAHTDVSASPRLVAILLPVVIVVTVALAVMLCICLHGQENCLKQAAVKLKNKGGSHAATEEESTDLFPIEPCGAVHVHNAGTVIFSWLGHVTEQVSSVPRADRVTDVKEEEQNGNQAPSSSCSLSVPLSEEERSSDALSFPSQEEGKHWHVSKEEALA
ncbi:uncharacterized protein si:dkey-260g12.1 [Corythoichthys intestinalis]|uniref:uncharacterized protein si:dkey-260g12.1 n=1 Tax=Corythoichthys intestinalis TaxID=161448 RepID=UPI0025A55654|nr:uncharacterized protein si:dkey-260g12.1 [Corythoichthys intestinalis]